MTAEPMLSVRNLETYYGPIAAIRGVSFDVPEGRIVTILGGNGAGKTTVLRSVCGALEPQKGTVAFAGNPIRGREPDWVARHGIAHVPEGREIFPFMTVKGNLMMGAYARGDTAGIARDMELVYGYFPVLRERADQAAGYLSGGQQQMLAIGRGLMARPKLMLLDEPSLGLSPLLTKEIFGIIRRLNAEQGVTMLLVEQNANMALRTAHYGYVLETGRIVLEGACEKLVQNDDVREFYLGHKETAVRGKKRWKRTKRWR
jgi:branched-chain amino acid transport system ATP-binding protein